MIHITRLDSPKYSCLTFYSHRMSSLSRRPNTYWSALWRLRTRWRSSYAGSPPRWTSGWRRSRCSRRGWRISRWDRPYRPACRQGKSNNHCDRNAVPKTQAKSRERERCGVSASADGLSTDREEKARRSPADNDAGRSIGNAKLTLYRAQAENVLQPILLHPVSTLRFFSLIDLLSLNPSLPANVRRRGLSPSWPGQVELVLAVPPPTTRPKLHLRHHNISRAQLNRHGSCDPGSARRRERQPSCPGACVRDGATREGRRADLSLGRSLPCVGCGRRWPE